MAYFGSIELISGIKPKNNQTYPLVNSKDVYVSDDERLDEALIRLARTDTTLTLSNVAADGKATGDAINNLTDNITEKYNTVTQYHAGDYCFYNNALYRCTGDTSGQWTVTKWTRINVMGEITSSTEGVDDIKNIIASEFNPPYAVGDYCIYNNKLYRCISPVSAGAQWSASKWTPVILTKDITDKIDTVQSNLDSVSNTVNGHTTSITNLNTNVTNVTNEVNDLKDAFDIIVDGVHSNNSPIIIDENTNNVKVTGLHINSNNVDTDLKPTNYSTGVTYEIKATSVLFGNELPEGITGDYCVLITYMLDSRIGSDITIPTANIKPFQMVYCNTNGGYYKRMANNATATTWNNWVFNEITRTVKEMVIVSNSQPTTGTQRTGEYWYSTI